MKKITEIILDKEAPLNLKSLWAEPQDDSTVALKVFNNGKWASTSKKEDLSVYQTKTDESLQTSDKTIVGAINELNSNIDESGYNLIEYGVTTYDELVEIVGNNKPTFLKVDGNILPVILQDTRESPLGGISILPQIFSGMNSNISGKVAVSLAAAGFFIVTESGWPSEEVLKSTVMLNISNFVQDNGQLEGTYIMSAPSGTAVKNFVAEQIENLDIVYTSDKGNFQDWADSIVKKSPGIRLGSKRNIPYLLYNTNFSWHTLSIEHTSKRDFSTDTFYYVPTISTGKINSQTGKYTEQGSWRFTYETEVFSSNETGIIPTSKIIAQYLTDNYQPIITPGTGLAFNGNTLNVTLDTNVFFVAESAPASPTDDQKKKVCLVPADITEEGNLYTEYVWVVDDEHPDGYWEEFGTYKSEVDLTPYLKSVDAANTYLSKTDAQSTYLSKTEGASTYATKTEVTGKQDTLVSGTNIKTINGEPVLGEGDIEIDAPDLSAYQTKEDSTLATAVKTIVGAINEINSALSALITRVEALEDPNHSGGDVAGQ